MTGKSAASDRSGISVARSVTRGLQDPQWRTDLSAELALLPSDWRLVRVGTNKAPIAGTGWFDADHYSPDDAAELNGSMPPAWGLKCGPASGVLVLDLDAPGWRESFQGVTGHPITDLPSTIGWSSGKPERSAHAFTVDPDWWPFLRNRVSFTREWREGDPLGKDGKRSDITLWELRWDRHQSVVIGAHPETGSYHWLPERSPADIPDPAPAPDWLLDLLVVQEHPAAKPVEPTADDADRAVAMLSHLPAEQFNSYDDWLRIGMALHHTDPGLLTAWVDWCRAMANFDEGECLTKWESFGKGHRGRPATIATLHHLAKQHGYKEPKRRRSGAQERQQGASDAAQANGTTVTAAGGRRVRLAPDDVLSLLPQRVGRLRLNVRTGDVHSPTGVLSGNQIGRLYLELSSVAETWPKDATTDAVMLLAHRDQFDPVKDWLEGLEAEPLPMEQWNELDRHLLGIDDPIARKALPRYLIGAIARTMEPGCYVRQTPVLIGPQERGKTELGRILFSAEHWVEGVGALDRDALQRAGTAWGVELAELDGVTRRRDQEQLKAFLTETCDSYRIAYDRAPERHPRRFVFWATANRPPLRDSTGSTRFVCIPIPDQMLPLDWARQNRDALWARALEQYRAGVTWLRTDEQERKDVEERNSEFIELDPWADAIAARLAEALEGKTIPVTVPSLLDRLNVPKERQNTAMALRVRQIAESLGWQHGRRRWNGSKNKVAGLFPPQDPGHPSGHPGHPTGHPPGTPADPNQRNGSAPVGHPGHPNLSKGSTEGEQQQGRPAAATAPMGQQHAFQRVDVVLGCPGCPPQQTDSSATDLPGMGGVPSGVPRGVPRGAQGCPPDRIAVGSAVAKWSKAERRHLPGWVVIEIDGQTATIHRPGSPGRCTVPLDQLVAEDAT